MYGSSTLVSKTCYEYRGAVKKTGANHQTAMAACSHDKMGQILCKLRKGSAASLSLSTDLEHHLEHHRVLVVEAETLHRVDELRHSNLTCEILPQEGCIYN